jgi:putative intracellular protease/amidase
MNLAFQFVRFGALVVVSVVMLFVAGVFAFVPGERRAAAKPAAVSAEEVAQTLAALKPPKRARPVVAVVGANDGTETTDYLIPYGVLKRSGAADVVALGAEAGSMKMMPSLTIMPEATTAQFAQRYPDGADYVIVPALHAPTNAVVRDFIRAQAAQGATIVGICDGTLVMANAGLLDGHRATGHWFQIDSVAAAHPTMQRVRDRRYVADRGIVTTTGVSASVPVSLALVEAIAGRERAAALAQEIGARGWSAEHDSGAFHLVRDDVWMILGNLFVGVFDSDTVGVRVPQGADVIAAAFTADSYGRTFRTRAVVPGAATIRTAEGLEIVPDAGGATPDIVVDFPKSLPVHALDVALAGIKARYGDATAAFVRVQLEDRGHTTGG